MSEAETPKQQNLEETAISEVDGAEVRSAANEDADLTVRALDSSAPSQPEATPIERFERRIALETTDPIAPDPSSLPPLKEADWLSLARKLRHRNRDLLKKVASLEKALAESQEALQAEVARSRGMETMGTQQSKELQISQEKIDLLLGELELSQQEARRQQIATSQLSKELARSRQQVAQLEQDCDRLHQHYTEQTEQIQEAQQQSRELYARLQRQQRQTLQFKAALDKCLDTQIPQVANSATEEQEPQGRALTTPLTIAAQPIQPWSNQSEVLEEPSEEQPAWTASTWDEDSANEEFDIDDAAIAAQMALFDLDPDAQVPIAPSQQEEDWENDPDPTSPEYDAVNWMLDAIDVPSSTLEGVAEEVEVSGELEAELELEEKEDDSPTLLEVEPEEHSPFALPEPLTVEPRRSPVSASAAPTPNSPSPLLYPRRPQTRRKTFAAIDLPNFPRWNPSQT